jgi:hypothetical protein
MRTLKPFTVRSASSTLRTESFTPTATMGLRSALAVGLHAWARALLLLLPKKLLKIDPPKSVIADDFGAFLVAGEPGSAFRAVRKYKFDGIGLVLLSLNLSLNESPQIGGRGWFADY